MSKRYYERPHQEYEPPVKLVEPPLPPLGSWVSNASGAQGEVVEHVIRPGRPQIVRVRFGGGKHGSYQPGELRDASR